MTGLVKRMIKKFRKVWISRTKKVVFKPGCNISLNSIFLGNNVINEKVVFQNSSIGFGSFIGGESFMDGTKIGRYCSIGPRVKVVAGMHPTHTFVSTHPAFYSLLKQSGFSYVNKQRFEEIKYAAQDGCYVSIGNDVWIGADVRILGGVSIGDGAIVGANALVTADVEPYSIVAGTPAKHIRYRFTQDEIEFLVCLQWWNKSEAWLMEHVEYFHDIELLRAVVQGDNKEVEYA
ncbi:CatB-related O-acetyltransferase [Paenibacillus terrigena]|uniref:CatB-related O-acetyltransferase n=1 Tax=Paenibacillus terrigena TaxID=369333 RepID=UPI000371FAC7